jgi:hypothetical protein
MRKKLLDGGVEPTVLRMKMTDITDPFDSSRACKREAEDQVVQHRVHVARRGKRRFWRHR